MLICWGEKDFVFDSTSSPSGERRFPAAEVHRFPDAGHYVLEDAGADHCPGAGFPEPPPSALIENRQRL